MKIKEFRYVILEQYTNSQMLRANSNTSDLFYKNRSYAIAFENKLPLEGTNVRRKVLSIHISNQSYKTYMEPCHVPNRVCSELNCYEFIQV